MVEQVGPARAPAYQLRVEDLFAITAKVTAVCYLCKHEAGLDPLALLKHWTRHERLTEVEKHLHCRACGARGAGACTLRVEWR